MERGAMTAAHRGKFDHRHWRSRGAEDDIVFAERLEELNEELEVLNLEARELEERIAQNMAKLLEQD